MRVYMHTEPGRRILAWSGVISRAEVTPRVAWKLGSLLRVFQLVP